MINQFHRRRFLSLAAGFAVLPTVSRIAYAQAYPARPITIVVAFPAGGPTDLLGRVLAEQIKASLGQPVLIENRPGASGTTGSASVVKAPPDGYTLLLSPNAPLTLNPYLQKNFPFHSLTALAPITSAAVSTVMLAVNSSLPVNNMTELVEHARKNPGKLSYGSAGVGSGHHLAGELLKQKAGVDITHVPYRGISIAVQDLIAGHIPISFGGTNTLPQHVATGKIRILAVAENKRADDLPDIPTMAESYPGVAIPVTWFGLLAPANTPTSIIDKLNSVVGASLRNADVITKLKQQGQIAVAHGPDGLARNMREEIAFYDGLIPSIGILPE